MRLDTMTLTEQDLIQFLHKWISNEGYHNLETLSIYTEHRINIDLIRQAIEFEEYDPSHPEKRPADYRIDQSYVSSTPITLYLNEDFVEIKRITDGKRAFLALGPFDFDLLVHKD
ncbi:unnamed protein product [Caenorhabditis nigoni]